MSRALLHDDVGETLTYEPTAVVGHGDGGGAQEGRGRKTGASSFAVAPFRLTSDRESGPRASGISDGTFAFQAAAAADAAALCGTVTRCRARAAKAGITASPYFCHSG